MWIYSKISECRDQMNRIFSIIIFTGIYCENTYMSCKAQAKVHSGISISRVLIALKYDHDLANTLSLRRHRTLFCAELRVKISHCLSMILYSISFLPLPISLHPFP